MELKQSYKKTEVGLIPCDWDMSELSQLTSLMTNGFVGTVKSQYTESDDGVTYIQGYNVEENSFNYRGIKKVTQEFHKLHLKSSLQEGDILTIQTGDVGLSTIVPKELVGSNCHALIISRFKKDKYYSKYFSFYLNSNEGRARLKEIEIGTTMKHINVGDMLRFLVPVPPKSEQIAIATALSNIDELIAQTEKLIHKKKAIKQGVMQELLKPKEGWVKVSVKEISKVGRGRVINQNEIQKSLGGKYPVYSSQTSNYGIMGFIDSYDFDGEYITWTTDGENAGTVFYRNGKFNCTNVCGTIKLKNFNVRFIAYVLAIEAPKHVSRNLANPKLMNEPMKNIEILIPSDINTQSNIASILLTIENEIDLQVGKLNKLKLKKQGMMQALLTGKIRLL